jgi:hypothetical protein
MNNSIPTDEIARAVGEATSPAEIREAVMRAMASQGKAQLTVEGNYIPTLGVGGKFSVPSTEAPDDFAKRLQNATEFEDIAQLAREEQQRRLAGYVEPPAPKPPEPPKPGESLHMDVLVNGRVQRIFADSYGGLDIQFANLQKHFGATEI